MDAIQTDSRWRDALVLYAEIAPDEEAVELANHAWSYANRLLDLKMIADPAGFVEARHALRFLIEAFRNRREVILGLERPIYQMIYSKLNLEHDYLEVKTVLEAVGLLRDKLSYPIILYVLARFPPWLAETVGTSARYLRKIDQRLAFVIYASCIKRAGGYSLGEIRRQIDVLSISDTTSLVAKWLRWHILDVYRTYFLLVVLIVVAFARGTFKISVALGIGIAVYLICYLENMFAFTEHWRNIILRRRGRPGRYSTSYITGAMSSIRALGYITLGASCLLALTPYIRSVSHRSITTVQTPEVGEIG